MPWPTSAPAARPQHQVQTGILGPRPQSPAQAYSVQSSPTATDIEAAMHTMGISQPDPNWYMDTGATSHMTSAPGTLSSYSKVSTPSGIIVGNGHSIPICGLGHATLPSPNSSSLTLKNVLHAPAIVKNLVSVRKFTSDNSVTVEFDPCGFSIKDLRTGNCLMRCDSQGALYPITTSQTSHTALAAVAPSLWHSRLGHPGVSVLSLLRQNKFINCSSLLKNSVCPSCIVGKQTRLPFVDSTSCTQLPFDIVHSDVWTSPVLSSSGHRYYVLFLDDYTNFLWTFPLSHKSQVFQTFLNFRTYVRTQFGRDIKTFQCDNGTEFDNLSFRQLATNTGMTFRFSCPYTSSQNGKAERQIRTINNSIRTLLAHASVPLAFWHHALHMVTYLLNILPKKHLSYQSPLRCLYHKDPSYAHIRVFGCLCYPLLPSPHINKLQPRSTPCVFLGFPPEHRGYKCYDMIAKKIIVCRHVIFDETRFPFIEQKLPLPSYSSFGDSISPYITHHLTHDTRDSPATPRPDPPVVAPTLAAPLPAAPLPPLPAAPLPTASLPTAPPLDSRPVTRSQRGIFKPKHILNLHTSIQKSPIPRTPLEALHDPNWKLAMDDEYKAILKNNTWVLVPRPLHVNVIRSMWIFTHKERADGSFERHKARLVGNGKTQQVGVDCGETFSPVVKPTTIRTVLSLAISKRWPIHQLDVKNAFLHGELGDKVYMHQPFGFRDPNFPDHVCLLQKSLYGLKQAPRAWNKRFTDFVATMGFSRTRSDHSLFVYHDGDHMAYLLLYVDDIILTASSDSLRRSIISRLSSEFAMKDLGPLHYFLGIAVHSHANGMFLSQRKYASEIIARAGLSSCKPSLTPVDTKPKLSSQESPLLENSTLYRSLAGALQYLTFTRPDIAYAVQQVCLFMHSPREIHFAALKRILRYIQGTLSHGLHLYASSPTSLVSYTDADWGGCPDTRRSTSGYCVFLGDNLISWSAKRQTTLSRSSAEAEYRGVANVVSESCWIRNLLLELHCPLLSATLVYCDNVSTIYLTGNPVQHQRTKHIEMDIHFVRDQVARGQVRVLHVPSRYQLADIFTKGLPQVLFEEFRTNLSVRSPPALIAGVS